MYGVDTRNWPALQLSTPAHRHLHSTGLHMCTAPIAAQCPQSCMCTAAILVQHPALHVLSTGLHVLLRELSHDAIQSGHCAVAALSALTG